VRFAGSRQVILGLTARVLRPLFWKKNLNFGGKVVEQYLNLIGVRNKSVMEVQCTQILLRLFFSSDTYSRTSNMRSVLGRRAFLSILFRKVARCRSRKRTPPDLLLRCRIIWNHSRSMRIISIRCRSCCFMDVFVSNLANTVAFPNTFAVKSCTWGSGYGRHSYNCNESFVVPDRSKHVIFFWQQEVPAEPTNSTKVGRWISAA